MMEVGGQKLRQAAKEDPRDLSHRTALAQNRERAIFEMLSAADQDLAGGRDAEAERQGGQGCGRHRSHGSLLQVGSKVESKPDLSAGHARHPHMNAA